MGMRASFLGCVIASPFMTFEQCVQCKHGNVPDLVVCKKDCFEGYFREPMSALIRVSFKLVGLLVQIIGGVWNSGISM